MTNPLLSLLGWSFLPDLLTGYLQSFFYTLTNRAGDPKPAPGTPRHNRHRRRIQSLVILAYLAYSLYEAHWEITRDGDFYRDLGVPVDVDERSLQTRFRKLTLQHHPDKLPAHERASAQAYYVHLKLARDTLLDPAKRFAYDRFGPDVVEWQGVITLKEHVMYGLRGVAPFYAGSGLVLVLLGWFGFGSWGGYWRYLSLLALAAYELHTLTSPAFPTLLPSSMATLLAPLRPWLPKQIATTRPYLPHQTLTLLHKAFLSLFLALNRLGPQIEQSILSGNAAAPAPTAGSAKHQLDAHARRLEQATAANLIEANRLVALETVPFRSADMAPQPAAAGRAPDGATGAETPAVDALRQRVRDYLVTATVRSDAGVRGAVQKVLEKRRAGGSGAGLESPAGSPRLGEDAGLEGSVGVMGGEKEVG